MTKNMVILLLSAMLVWFGTAIVRLENYHYASMLGMCGEVKPLLLVQREECLMAKQTRTSPIYHLLYGLRIL